MKQDGSLLQRLFECIGFIISFCFIWFMAFGGVVIILAIVMGNNNSWLLRLSILISFVLSVVFVVILLLSDSSVRFYLRRELPIAGPPPFRQSVERVLQELRENAPHRYKEVIRCLPKAKYDPSLHPRASGMSDGRFSVDGSGENSKQLNTYEWFRFVFLHEVGHVVSQKKGLGSGEWAADAYANMVLEEMGFPTYM